MGRFNIVQIISSSQLGLQIHCNANQNPRKLFCECWQNDSVVYMERKKDLETQIDGDSLRADTSQPEDFLQSKVVKTGQYWWENRQVNQRLLSKPCVTNMPTDL